MNCTQCDSELICRTKDYGGNFAPTLQWQNYDGSAHYKTTDGKNFDCNVPDEEETEQTRIPSIQPPSSASTQSPTAFTPGNSPQLSPDLLSPLIAIKNTVENIELHLQRMDEMIQAIFRNSIDEQLKKK